MLDRIRALITRQPLASTGAAITALAVAGIGVVNAFAPGTVTDAQVQDITKALAGLWVALALVWPLVTPVKAPKLREGSSVKLHDGTAGTVTKA
jgi:formate hydrogenlyase subunit 3/multisubunit Na+/H+ antiporter MnhD subunit